MDISKKTQRRIGLLLAIGLASAKAGLMPGALIAQAPPADPDGLGRTYLVAFPDTVGNTLDLRYPNTRVRSSVTLALYSVAHNNRVRISWPGGATTLTLNPGATQTYQIDPMPVIDVAGTPSAKVVRVEADQPVALYCFLTTPQGMEAWTPRPIESWGRDYYAATIPGEWVEDVGLAGEVEVPSTPKEARPELLVIASEDNTHVTINTSAPLESGTPTAVTLQSGWAYLVRSELDTAMDRAGHPDPQSDLGGTRILSDKPIAVISGNPRAQAQSRDVGLKNNAYKNMLMEWLAPSSQWGTEHVYLPTSDARRPGAGATVTRQFEYVRLYSSVAGSANGTYINGVSGASQAFTVPGGDLAEIALVPSDAFDFRTDRPVQAMMHSSAIVDMLGSTPCFRGIPCLSYRAWAPYMVALTPREQWVEFAPYWAPDKPATMQHYINVVADSVSAPNIFLGTGSRFLFSKRIAGTDLVWGTMSLLPGGDGIVVGTGGARFAGYVYGLASGSEDYRPGRALKKDGGVSPASGGASAPAAMHPSEYEEYNALSYGYPLVASGRTTSGVADDPGRAGYAIRVSRSNPARAGVAFEYTLGRAGDVTVDIYNDLGDRVAVLVDGRVAEGSHIAEWDASGVPSGAYFCRIAAGAWRDAVRFVVQH